MSVEHEVKLSFPDVEAARQAVITAGGRLDVSRRLLDDRLFDTPEQHLRAAGGALRVRHDGAGGFITFKGPLQTGHVKSREEIETAVGDADVAQSILIALGFRVWFRAQKFREEYLIGDARVTVDETPFAVFVEIEAAPDAIDGVAARLGRGREDYRLESYPALWDAWCRAHGRSFGPMMFESAPDRSSD